jgi:type 1 glutamine amidotransferase
MKTRSLMKKLITIAILPVIFFIFIAAKPADKKPSVLIFSKTNGYHHACIPVGIEAIKKLGQENGFSVDTTTDSLLFTKKNLKKYAAVIFLCPTLKVLGPEQEEAFQYYIQQGGGFVGIHSATDCEYNWPWYGKLVGAYFKSHPAQQEAKLMIVDKNHPSTMGMPDSWVRKDEWYNFRDLNPDVTVLIKIDESSYTGGENGNNHPMAWYHEFDGGRAFYTELGHTDESYSDPIYLKHLLGGIEWAMNKPKS